MATHRQNLADRPGSGTVGDAYYMLDTGEFHMYDHTGAWVNLGTFSEPSLAMLAVEKQRALDAESSSVGTALDTDGNLAHNGDDKVATQKATKTYVDKLKPVATPASAGAAGVAGQWSYDATHIYVCIATNTWVRATLATW